MKMKIAFFEAQDEEKEFFKSSLKKQKVTFFNERLTEKNISKAKDYECISVFVYSKINHEILDKLPNLKFIVTRSMGFDHIDLNECAKRGIKVANAPHYGDNSVAEHTFGLILSLSRNIHKAYVRTLQDNHSIDGLEGFDLKGKTIGVIGAGRIGSQVIKIANAFGMKVIVTDHHKDIKFARQLGFKYVNLDNLLKNSDIITLHVPYVKENHHLINANKLNIIKKDAILINTSRGAIVDTKALFNALKSEKLAGVGIDVIEGEELIKEEKELIHSHKKLDLKKMKQIALDHKILFNEKVVFTPHIAFYTREAVKRIMESTIDDIKGFINKRYVNLIGN